MAAVGIALADTGAADFAASNQINLVFVGLPMTATLAGEPAMPFTTWGVVPQRDGVVLGIGANTGIAEATSVYLRHEGNISSQDSAHAITAGLRMMW